jgi:hypothetical protein
LVGGLYRYPANEWLDSECGPSHDIERQVRMCTWATPINQSWFGGKFRFRDQRLLGQSAEQPGALYLG